MKIYTFKGIQKKGEEEIDVNGYFNILPKEYEFKIPISGKFIIKKEKMLYEVKGDLTSLLIGQNPSLSFFTRKDDLEFAYELQPVNFEKEIITYKGNYISSKDLTAESLLVFMSGVKIEGANEIILDLTVDESFKNLLL